MAEEIQLNLYLNAGFVNISAGEASIIDTNVTFNKQNAILTTMVMTTNPTADKIFPIRDTIRSYNTPDGDGLYFTKMVNEGNNHFLETALYSKNEERYIVSMTKSNNSTGELVSSATEWKEERVYDILSMLGYARTIETSHSELGQTETLFMVNGDMVVQQYIVYTGNSQVKADNGITYDCMVISVRDYKEGKERETIKAYVTHDTSHKPVRLDIKLGMGVAIKALLK